MTTDSTTLQCIPGGRALTETHGCDWRWPEYYREFPYFSENSIRAGCHPRKLVHREPTENSIVLVHGLTDSPYFMLAMSEYFHRTLGYNVYLPLLQCHGLTNPEGMVGVSLEEWKNNVRFAVRTAAADGGRVSIGGLSTGGALGFYMVYSEAAVTGELFLFSPALGIADGRFNGLGRMTEILLRTRITRYFDSRRPLVGINPYRYDRISLNSAEELAVLIRENDLLMAELRAKSLEPKRTFAVWSECDRVVSLTPIHKLAQLLGDHYFSSFVVPESEGVEHAGVVLREPLYAIDAEEGEPPLEEPNSLFAEMLAAIDAFVAVEPAA